MVVTYAGQAKDLEVIGADFRYVVLFQNDIEVTPNTVYGDLTLADFGGYAPQLITWGAVRKDECRSEMLAVPMVFTATGTPLPQTIYGYAIIDSISGPLPGTTVLRAHRFECPKTLKHAGDSVVVQPGEVATGCCGCQ